MRDSVFLVLIFTISYSCSKKGPAADNSDYPDESASQIVYDTTAIDSFGPGATSVAVMAKINAVAIKKRQDSLALIAKAEQDKMEKEKLEKEKETQKQTEETKPETQKDPQTDPPSTTEGSPINP